MFIEKFKLVGGRLPCFAEMKYFLVAAVRMRTEVIRCARRDGDGAGKPFRYYASVSGLNVRQIDSLLTLGVLKNVQHRQSWAEKTAVPSTNLGVLK